MRTIYIAQYRGKSVISCIIRWMSWGIYSHTAIVLPDENWAMYESWEGVGVRRCKSISDGHTPGTQVDFFELQLEHESQYQFLVRALDSQLGKKYDYLGCLRFSPFLRLFMKHEPTRREQGTWFCSEYGCWALADAGKPILNRPYWKISPSDVPSSPLLRFAFTEYTGKHPQRPELALEATI